MLFKKKYSLASTFLFWMMAVGLLAVAGIGLVWFFTNHAHLKADLAVQREQLLHLQKQRLENEVKQAVNYIEYKKAQTLERLKRDVRNRVHEAHAMAMHIYETYRHTLSQADIEKLVIEALRKIRFNHGRGYFFATHFNGIEMLFADHPEYEGQNLIDLRDTKGKYVIRDMIALAKRHQEGFYEYTWTKPKAAGKGFPKIAFIKHFEPFDWLIGTGEYLDAVEKDIKAEVLEYISTINSGKEDYIFVGQYDGLSLLGPASGRNMLQVTDAKGVKIVHELIAAAQKGGGYLEYMLPPISDSPSVPKLSYVAPVPGWQWYVGTGVHLNSIEALIRQRESENDQIIQYQIIQGLLTLTGLYLLLCFILRLISGRIQKKHQLVPVLFSGSRGQRRQHQSGGASLRRVFPVGPFGQ